MTLAEYEQILLFGANEPVSTFAYQNKALSKVPPGCTLHCIASPEHDITNALIEIESKVGSSQETVPRVPAPTDNTPPVGELSSAAIGRSIRLLMPDNAIMVDEGATAAMGVINETQFGPKHDYLYTVCGGAIGAGLPITLGASVACPERKIITLQADGSALYTNQALWSLAREQSDAIIIVLKNNAYAILNVELARVSAEPPNAAMQAMMNLDQPTIDWVQLAQSMGVRATSVSTAEGFHEAFAEAVNGKGPVLIEAVIAQDLSAAIAMMRAQE